jgi:two-component system, OmpR family, response regulator MtrA
LVVTAPAPRPPAPHGRTSGVADLRPVPSDGAPGGAVPAAPAGPELEIRSGTRTVRHGDRALALTRLEFDLLLFLAEHPRQVFTRRQLLSHVWGYEHAVARPVDVHVRRLRAKAGPGLPLVATVYGVGYRLADEARIVVDPAR